MKSCVLRFPGHAHADLVLTPGATGIGPDPDHERGLRVLPLGESALIELVLDNRGIWMNVAPGTWGVHVNGRPVQRLAMLHAGDVLHVEGQEMLLACTASRGLQPALDAPSLTRQWDVVPVLRGLGGLRHGEAVPVRGADGAPLQLEGVIISLDRLDVRARCADPALRMTVNGLQVQEAVLMLGDQLVLPQGQRFLLEGPDPRADAPLAAAIAPAPGDPRADGHVTAPAGMRAPWLLIAAVVIALALLALFWFGV